MKVKMLHSWDVSTGEARTIQNRLRSLVKTDPPIGFRLPPRLVAGVDVACPRSAPVAVAGAVVMRLPDMKVIERRSAVTPLSFPYVPGYLSFREGEAVSACLRRVESDVDAILFDGQGICHPRRFGLASHLGLLTGKPSVGCAKSLLTGTHAEPARAAGSRRRITADGEVLGASLRTRDGVRTVYVSIGHLIDLPAAIRVVLACCRGYRLPEPQREAHRWVTELSRAGADSLCAAAVGAGSC
jgi:deoxyribonuclease V